MSSRIHDLLAPHAGRWSVIVDASTGDLDIAAFVRVVGVPVMSGGDESAMGQVSDGRQRLVVITAGPDAGVHGSVEHAAAALAGVSRHDDVLLLLGWRAPELVDGELATELARCGVAADVVVGTPYREIPVAVLGRLSDTGAEDDGRFLLDSFSRIAAEQLVDEVTQLRQSQEALVGAGPMGRAAELMRERASLADEVRQLRARVRSAERRADSLEASTALRIGRAVVAGARNPRSLVKLPREAYRMLRLRGGRRGGASTAPSTATSPLVVNEESRLVAWRGGSLPPRTGSVVAGVLREVTQRALSDVAQVSVVTPDDASAVIDKVSPDVVIIETAAGGAEGVWSHLGDPSATERERRLLRLTDAAQAAGHPVVLWRNSAPHLTAALADFGHRCDLVLDGPGTGADSPWSVGVPLRGAVALPSAPTRSGVLVTGGLDPREPAVRKEVLLAAVRAAGDDLVIRPLLDEPHTVAWPEDIQRAVSTSVRGSHLGAAAASAAVVVARRFTAPGSAAGVFDDDLVALASGARLVSGPNRLLMAEADLAHAVVFADPTTVVDNSALMRVPDAATAVRRAQELGAQTPQEHWATLQCLVAHHSTYSRWRRLLAPLGLLPPSTAEQDISVVMEPLVDGQMGSAQSGERLVADLARQTQRPLEVVASRSDLPDARVRDELVSMGITVTLLDDSSSWSERARSVGTTHCAVWSPHGEPWGPSVLADLYLGGYLTGADLVHWSPDAGIARWRSGDSANGPIAVRRDAVIARDPQEVAVAASWALGQEVVVGSKVQGA